MVPVSRGSGASPVTFFMHAGLAVPGQRHVLPGRDGLTVAARCGQGLFWGVVLAPQYIQQACTLERDPSEQFMVTLLLLHLAEVLVICFLLI